MNESERIDQLESHYQPVENCEKWVGRLFWVCAFLSCGILYSNLGSIGSAQNIVQVLFVIVVVAHSLLSHYGSLFLFPFAENLRRKQLLSDAFGVALTPEITEGYYNNDLAPSFLRLGVCVLENSFFGKNVCGEMAKKERMKIFFYFLFWVAAVSYRSTDLGFVLVLTQTLFSADILARYLKIEILRARNASIYNDLYGHFLNQTSSAQSLPGIATILHSFASYETAKGSAALKQSSSIFHRLNPSLMEEWDIIRGQLGIDN